MASAARLLRIFRSFVSYRGELVSSYERPLTLKEVRAFAKPFKTETSRSFGLPASRLFNFLGFETGRLIRYEDALLRNANPIFRAYATVVVFRIVKTEWVA